MGPGISVTGGAGGTAIQNNVIGLAADGKTPLGNQGDGIDLDDAPGTLIGGTDLGEGNVISANLGNGIDTPGDTAELWVAGNEIGTDATGCSSWGTSENGINLASSTNSIGGTVAGASNIIEYNGSGKVGAGVQLVGMVFQNSILSNSIYANAGLGINLGSGPTPNHAPGTPGPQCLSELPGSLLRPEQRVQHLGPGLALRDSRHRPISSSSSPARNPIPPASARARS